MGESASATELEPFGVHVAVSLTQDYAALVKTFRTVLCDAPTDRAMLPLRY